MSPTKMIKKAVGMLAMAVCAVPFWNCGSNSPEDTPTGSLEAKTASVALRLTHADVPLMDSIVVECIGADSLHLTAGAKDARAGVPFAFLRGQEADVVPRPVIARARIAQKDHQPVRPAGLVSEVKHIR